MSSGASEVEAQKALAARIAWKYCAPSSSSAGFSPYTLWCSTT